MKPTDYMLAVIIGATLVFTGSAISNHPAGIDPTPVHWDNAVVIDITGCKQTVYENATVKAQGDGWVRFKADGLHITIHGPHRIVYAND